MSIYRNARAYVYLPTLEMKSSQLTDPSAIRAKNLGPSQTPTVNARAYVYLPTLEDMSRTPRNAIPHRMREVELTDLEALLKDLLEDAELVAQLSVIEK